YYEPENLLELAPESFSFSSLYYKGSIPVLGSTGPSSPTPLSSGEYYRGHLDAFGDEWHSICVADDDGQLHDSDYSHYFSSDGKEFLFVVNPNTPMLFFTQESADSEYYTTPAKTYFLPRIHEQMTYVSDGIGINLHSFDHQAISYRWGEGEWQAYREPLLSTDLDVGLHVLSYKMNDVVKSRSLYKSPSSPSLHEVHSGKLLWGETSGLSVLKEKVKREPYATHYKWLRDDYLDLESVDDLNQGQRLWQNNALSYALVAMIEGVDSTLGLKYAKAAKKCLLDNKLSIDPVGFELNHNFAPMPSAEWSTYGYYSVNNVYDVLYAYDLLIHSFLSTEITGGITPIEELKIRDSLARWVAVNLNELRGYEGDLEENKQPDPSLKIGMWDFARHSASALTAICMSDYESNYYGVSGYNGSLNQDKWPFEDQALTWKDIYEGHSGTLSQTPGKRIHFNHLEGGLITTEGLFADRIDYYSYHLLGHCLQKFAVSSVATIGKRYEYLEKSFKLAVQGKLKGLKVSTASDSEERLFPLLLLSNEYFPDIADDIIDSLKDQPDYLEDGSRNKKSLSHLLYESLPYGLIFHDDLWASRANAQD
ncbi:MAG: hypothetical protein HQL32_07510, partial [Planctomycetes bacterium]|nr:hypothetical protein [Planctomycetota bacterium]